MPFRARPGRSTGATWWLGRPVRHARRGTCPADPHRPATRCVGAPPPHHRPGLLLVASFLGAGIAQVVIWNTERTRATFERDATSASPALEARSAGTAARARGAARRAHAVARSHPRRGAGCNPGLARQRRAAGHGMERARPGIRCAGVRGRNRSDGCPDTASSIGPDDGTAAPTAAARAELGRAHAASSNLCPPTKAPWASTPCRFRRRGAPSNAARRSGRPTATPGFRLTRNPGAPYGVVLYQAHLRRQSGDGPGARCCDPRRCLRHARRGSPDGPDRPAPGAPSQCLCGRHRHCRQPPSPRRPRGLRDRGRGHDPGSSRLPSPGACGTCGSLRRAAGPAASLQWECLAVLADRPARDGTARRLSADGHRPHAAHRDRRAPAHRGARSRGRRARNRRSRAARQRAALSQHPRQRADRRDLHQPGRRRDPGQSPLLRADRLHRGRAAHAQPGRLHPSRGCGAGDRDGRAAGARRHPDVPAQQALHPQGRRHRLGAVDGVAAARLAEPAVAHRRRASRTSPSTCGSRKPSMRARRPRPPTGPRASSCRA